MFLDNFIALAFTPGRLKQVTNLYVCSGQLGLLPSEGKYISTL